MSKRKGGKRSFLFWIFHLLLSNYLCTARVTPLSNIFPIFWTLFCAKSSEDGSDSSFLPRIGMLPRPSKRARKKYAMWSPGKNRGKLNEISIFENIFHFSSFFLNVIRLLRNRGGGGEHSRWPMLPSSSDCCRSVPLSFLPFTKMEGEWWSSSGRNELKKRILLTFPPFPFTMIELLERERPATATGVEQKR